MELLEGQKLLAQPPIISRVGEDQYLLIINGARLNADKKFVKKLFLDAKMALGIHLIDWKYGE